MKLFLQKNTKRTEENKQPYFRLVVPPETDGGEWKDIGAFWKAKSGNGYSGKLNEGVAIIFEKAPATDTAPAVVEVVSDDVAWPQD